MDIAVNDERYDLPFMVHSQLDDLDLDPFEFRAYAHMVRRAGGYQGEHYESVDEGAKRCRMNSKTYRKALAGLVARRLVTREERTGQTSVYRLTPPTEWREFVREPTPTRLGTPAESDTPTTSGIGPLPHQGVPPTKNGRGPLPNQVDKGNPTKVIPLRKPTKASPRGRKPKDHEFNPSLLAEQLPEQFDRELFVDFCARRLEVGAPMTLLALKQFVTKHKHHPPDVLDEMFRAAIIGGWKDLYPPKDSRAKPPPGLDQYTERGL